MTSSNGSVPSEKSSSGAVVETENQLKRREATLLNSALRVELNREASFYLSTMDGIIEGGKHFIPGKCYEVRATFLLLAQLIMCTVVFIAVRIRDEENTNGRFQSEVAANLGRESYSSFGNSLSSSSISAAPMGFQSRDQVMQVFEYLLTHQSERQENIETSKSSQNAAASRASRRAGTAQSEKTKQNKIPSQPNRKSSRPTQKQQQEHDRSTFSEGETETSTTPSDTYGFTGIYMALFAGSGFLLHSARSKSQQFSDTTSMKGRRDRAAGPKGIRLSPIGKKTDEAEKQPTNFIWISFTAILGPAASLNLPSAAEGFCLFLSRLILKMIAFLGYVFAFRSTAWCNNSSVRKIIKQAHTRVNLFFEFRGDHVSPTVPTSSPVAKRTASSKVTKSSDILAQTTPVKKQKNSSACTKKGTTESKSSTDGTSIALKLNRLSKKIQAVNPHDENMTTQQPTETFVAFSSSTVLDSPGETFIAAPPTTPPTKHVAISELSSLDTSFHEADLQKPDATSPFSEANSEGTACETLTDDKVFDDHYWRSQDEQEIEESGWIESSAQSRSKARKALGQDKAAHLTPSPLRPKTRLQPLQVQHDRKTTESAFSSASGSVRDRSSNQTQQQVRRTAPARRPSAANHLPQHAPSSSSILPTTAPNAPAKQVQHKEISLSATSALKSILTRKASPQTHINNQDADCHGFPPLPSNLDSQYQSRSSSTENSTDMEDHSIVTDDSHLSSPRSRSPSALLDTSLSFEEEPLTGHMMHAHPNSLLQMPFCPMGFMPMHMANMPPLMYSPPMMPVMGPGSQHFTPTLPNNMTQEQQQALLLQHQQAMMMIPFPPMFLLPQHGFEAATNIHFRNLSEEQNIYNAQIGNQIYLDSLLHAQNQHTISHIQQSEHHLPNMTAPEGANDYNSETEIVDLVRRQM